MKSRFMKKFLASLFLAATFLGAVHHHDDAGIHHDCPIHILNTTLVAPDLSRETLLDEIKVVYPAVSSPILEYSAYTAYFSYFGRAPPLFS